tara:strand:- start:698 stop:1147 length:450 start_codon:yes stop_codon:yes gene_type:complete
MSESRRTTRKAYGVGTRVQSYYKESDAPYGMVDSNEHPYGAKVSWTGTVVASGRDFEFEEQWQGRRKSVLGHKAIPVDSDGKAFTVRYGKILRGPWPDEFRSPYHPDKKPWGYLPNPGCVFVKITHDENGQQIKARYVVLHHYWLSKVK